MASIPPGFLVGRSERGLLPHALRATYWNARAPWWDTAREPAELAARLGAVTAALGRHGLRPGWRVLDLGCGTGVAALSFAELGCRVIGLDFSAGMLRRARARAAAHPAHRLALVRADFEAGLALRPACLDAVVCVAALQFAARPASLLAEVARVLRPARGRLLLLVVRPRPRAGAGRGLPGLTFGLLGRLPGWRRRVRVRPRAEVLALVRQGGLDILEEIPVGPDLLLVARRAAVA
jgi:SAM-dependent methyltransferase